MSPVSRSGLGATVFIRRAGDLVDICRSFFYVVPVYHERFRIRYKIPASYQLTSR